MELLCSRYDIPKSAVASQYDGIAIRGPVKVCQYCKEEVPVEHYNQHLLQSHADTLFRCNECDKHIERKDLNAHMSGHDVHYAVSNKHMRRQERLLNSRRNAAAKSKKAKQVKKKTSHVSKETIKTRSVTRQTKLEIQTKNNMNEEEKAFSDHSDNEGFEPLPESIFQAIEDSQDSDMNFNENYNQTSEIVPTVHKEKKNKNQKIRTCPICFKEYKASSSYFYHMKYTHRGIKEHACTVCGRKFGTRANLAQHSTTHTKQCQYECNDCGKRFRSKVSLYIHIQTHNSVKEWSCEQCGRSFRWKQQLLRHGKRHAAERAYVCAECGRGFNIHYDLLRHTRTHNSESHKCQKCGVCFAQLRYLKVHTMKKHAVSDINSGLEDK